MNYLFSVIIPIFNSEKFIRKTIESVIKQKNPNTELILVNDKSTDLSKKICISYKKKYKFIKLFNNKKNLGVGFSRNLGIKKARGKYIVFLDSDDALLENSLNNLEKFITINNSPDVIPVRYQKITYPQNNYKFIKDNKKNHDIKKLIKYVLSEKIPFSDCWFFVFRRKFLNYNKIYFPNSRFGESEIFVAKTICYMQSFACFQKKFYHKKDRLNSLTHSSDYETTFSILNNLTQFNIFYNQNNFSKLKKKFLNNYIQGIFGVFTALIVLRDRKEILKISKILEKYKSQLKSFSKYPEKIDLKKLINNYGSFQGLLKYLEMIKKNKLIKINQINIQKNIIFSYCRSQYSAATIKILSENNINIQGVIDDNKNFINTNFMNFKTLGSKYILKKYKSQLKNIVIIITHQKTNTIKKITKFLIDNKISKNKIYSVKY